MEQAVQRNCERPPAKSRCQTEGGVGGGGHLQPMCSMGSGGYVLQRIFFPLGEHEHDHPSTHQETTEHTHTSLSAMPNHESATPLRDVTQQGSAGCFCCSASNKSPFAANLKRAASILLMLATRPLAGGAKGTTKMITILTVAFSKTRKRSATRPKTG